MQYRTFGRTGWRVAEVGYGMWGMAGWTGSQDEESFASLDRAIALGCIGAAALGQVYLGLPCVVGGALSSAGLKYYESQQP